MLLPQRDATLDEDVLRKLRQSGRPAAVDRFASARLRRSVEGVVRLSGSHTFGRSSNSDDVAPPRYNNTVAGRTIFDWSAAADDDRLENAICSRVLALPGSYRPPESCWAPRRRGSRVTHWCAS
jgi:hypothetical protein